MTTSTTPSPMEIMSDAALRAAAEAGSAVVAFDRHLGTVLFADRGGRALLGLSEGGEEAAPSPALRQVRSAARGLAETGRARALLRRSTRAGTRMVEAELTVRPVGAEDAAFVLLTVAGTGEPLADDDILAATGLSDRPAAVFANGARRAATAAFDEPSVPGLADAIARFEAEDLQTKLIEDGLSTLTLTRAPFGRIVALAEIRPAPEADVKAEVERPAASEPDFEAPAAASPAPVEPTTGFASFSVKRPRLGEPRPGMSMSALLTRWHSRGPDAGAPVGPRTATQGAAAPSETPATEHEAALPARAVVPEGGTADMSRDRAGVEAMPGDVGPTAEIEAPAEPMLHDGPAPEAEPAGEATGQDDLVPSSRSAEAEATSAKTDAPAEETRAHEPPAIETAEPSAPVHPPVFAPRFDIAPVRFVWQIDRDGAFRFLSPDFAGAVGPNAADVVGRSFVTVARVFGFDETREITRLLERRDTWSGRTILWPVEGSDRKVPVDLAALPVYGRDRSFDGFRGFGIVRLNESVPDPEGLGLHLTQGRAPTRDADAGPDAAPPAPVPEPPREKPFLRRFEAESFGRRTEIPHAPAEPQAQADADAAQKVIRLEERRRPREGALSTAEEAAFRAIGAKLGNKAEAESPGALRFEEPESPTPAASVGGSERDAREETPRAEKLAEAASMPTTPAPRLPSRIETDEIEPALEALSEKIARAEAEADRRLAARAKPAPAGEAEPARDHDEAAGKTAAPDFGDTTQTPPETLAAERPDAARSDEPAVVASAEAEAKTTDAPEAEGSPRPEPDAATAEAGPALAPGEPASDRADDARTLDAPSLAADEPSERIESRGDDEDGQDEEAEPALDCAVFERLFAKLPLAVLVQVGERTLYTNGEFATLTGHADAEAVEAAGGLDALVLDRQGEGTLALLRADGEIVEVRAHMQRIAEGGRSALLMSFSPAAIEEAETSPALDDLRKEVEELQAVLDTATDGVVLLDIDGHIRAMNGSAHALFGIGADDAFGRHLSTLFAPESQKAAMDYLEMLRDDGIGGILNDGREVIGRVSQGGSIPLFITIGRLSGDRGWCVVIRDIAHWKRIEEDLVNARRQAEAASLHKSRFLANISHELRTPLNAIIGFADVMSSECFGPIGNERYLEYLGDIKRSGHHVLDLVNDLLDISKIEAGKVDLSFEAVSLNEVISETVALMQPQANRERVIVRSNLPSSVPPVVADRRTMRQIALNLLSNAIRFTPAGGQIIASTTYSAEGDVLLRFRDSGIGMTEREIEIALTPFQQVHAPSANRGEGTGLGLPLTKAMVEANRAYFSIQSTPGEGTLVEIVFPAPRVLAD